MSINTDISLSLPSYRKYSLSRYALEEAAFLNGATPYTRISGYRDIL